MKKIIILLFLAIGIYGQAIKQSQIQSSSGWITSGLASKIDTETDPFWAGDKANYYTSSQVTSLLGGYYTKTESDNRYKAIGYVPGWTEITNKPTTFTPASHLHPISDVTNLQTSLNSKINYSDTSNSIATRSWVLLRGYLTNFTELDPLYSGSSWFTTSNNSANWNTAYSWGNHSTQGYVTGTPWTTMGYLTSYTETDPVYTANLTNLLEWTDTLTVATRQWVLDNSGGTVSWDTLNYYVEKDSIVDVDTLNSYAKLNDEVHFNGINTVTMFVDTLVGDTTYSNLLYNNVYNGRKYNFDISEKYTTNRASSIPMGKIFQADTLFWRSNYAGTKYPILTRNDITTTEESNWNTAYGWGNHSTAGYVTGTPWTSMGYLTSYTETDPIWTSASTNYYTKTNLQTSGQSSVHWNNITNEPTFLTSYTETDPVYTANLPNIVEFSDTNTKIATRKWVLDNSGGTISWDTLSYYVEKDSIVSVDTLDYYAKKDTLSNFLTSYTETDPIYSASSWFSTTNNSSNWNTAFGWGNHSGLYKLISYVPTWSEITSKPTEFTPSSHTHPSSQITDWGTYINQAVKTTSEVTHNKVTATQRNGYYIGSKLMVSDYSWGGNNNNLWLGGATNSVVTGTLSNEGNYLIGIGLGALQYNTIGNSNNAIGVNALYFNTEGYYNNAIGVDALYSNTIGNRNNAIGVGSLYDNISGNSNVALGCNTGGGITTGSGNTILGTGITGLSSDLTNNIILGSGSTIRAQFNGTNWSFTGSTLAIGSTYAELQTNKGVANGYASLGSDGKIPSTQLPANVDDWNYVRKTADEIVTNFATLQDDDHLVFAVESNSVYEVEYKLLMKHTNASVAGLKFGITTPTSTTWTAIVEAPYKGAGIAPNTLRYGVMSSEGSFTSSIGSQDFLRATYTMGYITIKGTFATGGTSGNIQLQWAQNTAGNTNTSTVAYTNSFVKYKKIF